jgi:hypothetical protein
MSRHFLHHLDPLKNDKFCDLNLSNCCSISEYTDPNFAINSVLFKLLNQFVEQWNNSLQTDTSISGRGGNKLRTCKLFISRFETEKHCKIPLPSKHRCYIAKFRCGVAPLRIQTVRFEKLEVQQRVCNECTNVVGDEAHVLLKCPLYIDFREELFYLAQNVNSDFIFFSDIQKFVFLFSDVNMIRMCAKTFYLILNARRNIFIVHNFILCVYIYIYLNIVICLYSLL